MTAPIHHLQYLHRTSSSAVGQYPSLLIAKMAKLFQSDRSGSGNIRSTSYKKTKFAWINFFLIANFHVYQEFLSGKFINSGLAGTLTKLRTEYRSSLEDKKKIYEQPINSRLQVYSRKVSESWSWHLSS